MSLEATAAPAAAPPPPAEGTPPPAPEGDDGQPRNAIERIVAKHNQKERQKAADTPPEPPAGDAKPKVEPPAEKPKEEGSSLQFAKLKQEHRQLTAAKVELSGKVETLTKEIEGIKGKFGRNPFKALEELTGKTFKEHVERASKGEYDERSGESPETREKLAKFEKWQQEQQAKETAQHEAAERAEDVEFATKFLTDAADAYPIFGAAEWAADELVDRAYAALKNHETPDLAKIAGELEQTALRNLESVVGNERILSALAKRPNVRQLLVKALGLSEQQSAARPASGKSGESDIGNGPRTLSHTTTQESPVPAPPSEESEDDWLAGAKARLAQIKQHGRIAGR